MPLPSGQISLSQVNTELGISPASTLITMNDAAVRSLAGVPTGAISMQNLQGKGAAFSLTISGNTNNYDLYNAAVGAGWPGSTAIQLTINPGVVVGSASTGNYSFLVPSALNPAPTVTVVNNGTIIGAGGTGGGGAFGNQPVSFTPAFPGVGGGIAMFINRPTVITNNGVVAGGGGGGGGGGGNHASSPTAGRRGGGGGGGGAGSIVGAGGPAGRTPVGTATAGTSGTLPAGGAGGAGVQPPGAVASPGYRGGTGGGQGSVGQPGFTAGNIGGGSGGTSGAYVVGAPLVTWPVTGTRLGPSS